MHEMPRGMWVQARASGSICPKPVDDQRLPGDVARFRRGQEACGMADVLRLPQCVRGHARGHGAQVVLPLGSQSVGERIPGAARR